MKTKMCNEIRDILHADSSNAERISKAILESKDLKNVEVTLADGSVIVLSNFYMKTKRGDK